VRALAVTIDRARVCIIVLKWNRRDKALACLGSLARGPRGFPASSSSTTARATARRRRSARASPPWRCCRSRRTGGTRAATTRHAARPRARRRDGSRAMWPVLVRLYLRVPLAHVILGKQMVRGSPV